MFRCCIVSSNFSVTIKFNSEYKKSALTAKQIHLMKYCKAHQVEKRKNESLPLKAQVDRQAKRSIAAD